MNATDLTAALRGLIESRTADVLRYRSLIAGAKLSRAEWQAVGLAMGYTLTGSKAEIVGRLSRNLDGLASSFYRAGVIAG